MPEGGGGPGVSNDWCITLLSRNIVIVFKFLKLICLHVSSPLENYDGYQNVVDKTV